MKAETEEQQYLYRYVDSNSVLAYEFPATTFNRCELKSFRILRETKCGHWIALYNFTNEYKKFVLKSSTKRYAHLLKADALASYKYRKQYQLKRLAEQLKATNERLAYIDVNYLKLLER